MSFYNVRKIWKPEIFQGQGKKKDYFEGWYFKMVSEDARFIHAVIAGIALSRDREKSHAFIQIINGKNGAVKYFEFPVAEFSASRSKFQVSLGKNTFSRDRISLDIESGGETIRGELSFQNLTPLPTTFFSPGIMGPYAFVPFMECYHGLVSLDHEIQGELLIDGGTVNYNGGHGYIEKDWGTSFPSSWIWMQCNHFEKPGTSLMLSVAKIPWLRSHFIGFLALLLHEGKIYRFTTYTGAKIARLHLDDTSVYVTLRDKSHVLTVKANRATKGTLMAPVKGVMERRISESVCAVIEAELRGNNGDLFFLGTSENAGLEAAGNADELLAGI